MQPGQDGAAGKKALLREGLFKKAPAVFPEKAVFLSRPFGPLPKNDQKGE